MSEESNRDKFIANELAKFNTKVFLGGTCNKSLWRSFLTPHLTIEYFNPDVENWTEECMAEEIEQREECAICLYAITEATSIYSIAEVVDDSNKRPEKTVFVIIDGGGFSEQQIKHLRKIADLVKSNGAIAVELNKDYGFEDLAEFLNKF